MKMIFFYIYVAYPDQAKKSKVNTAMGEFIAVHSKEYTDKPLIGTVTNIDRGEESYCRLASWQLQWNVEGVEG